MAPRYVVTSTTPNLDGDALGGGAADSGLDSARPAPGADGELYFATDTRILYVVAGGAWRVVHTGGGPDGLGLSGWGGDYVDGTNGGPGQRGSAPYTWAFAFTMDAIGGAQCTLHAFWNGSAFRGLEIGLDAITNCPYFGGALTGGGFGYCALSTGVVVGPNKYVVSWAVSATDLVVTASLNGGAAETFTITDAAPLQPSAYKPPTTSDTWRLGTLADGGRAFPTGASIDAMVTYAQALSAPQCVALSTLGSGADRYRILTPAGVTEDFALRFAHLGPVMAGRVLSRGATPRMVTLTTSLIPVVR